jgi:hypothetical protein
MGENNKIISTLVTTTSIPNMNQSFDAIGIVINSSQARTLIYQYDYGRAGVFNIDRNHLYFVPLQSKFVFDLGSKEEVEVDVLSTIEPKRMHLYEIEKLLGYPIEIIDKGVCHHD